MEDRDHHLHSLDQKMKMLHKKSVRLKKSKHGYGDSGWTKEPNRNYMQEVDLFNATNRGLHMPSSSLSGLEEDRKEEVSKIEDASGIEL